MNEFDLSSLQDIIDRMHCIENDFDKCLELDGEADEDDRSCAKSVMTEAEAWCRQEGFDDSLEVIQRTLGGFEYNRRDLSTMVAELRHIRESIYTELNKRTYIQIRENRRRFVNDVEMLGPGVASAFRSAIPDIYEAGNCFAAECNTAAVFHLMRVVEWGLRALCADLGLHRAVRRNKSGKKRYVPISYTDWETMLNQLQDRVDKKIEKLKRGKTKQAAQEFYYPALQDIRGIRDAWRNHVMHTRAKYISEEANAIMSHVSRLMVLLSRRVKEQ